VSFKTGEAVRFERKLKIIILIMKGYGSVNVKIAIERKWRELVLWGPELFLGFIFSIMISQSQCVIVIVNL
jgi:hypothetical protein